VLILREIEERDLESLFALATHLDSMNLPSDLSFLSARIETSLRSFSGEIADWCERIYVFVIEDTEAERCVGTSTIIAKQGRPGAPYYWLKVTSEERRSTALAKRFVHRKLQLMSTENGPTEIGGLILDPAYRNHPEKCGKALSTIRFTYISAHPELFEREVIAEMLSPFEESGENLLWNAFGAKFTELPYREADHLSARDKQFITDLFPVDPVYTTLFPPEVQAVIGKPNETAIAALRILERIGFRYLNQVDPFDGGPYYGAARDAITSVAERRELVLPGIETEPISSRDGQLALVSVERSHGFRATVVPLDEESTPLCSKACREALGVSSGDRVSVTPLP